MCIQRTYWHRTPTQHGMNVLIPVAVPLAAMLLCVHLQVARFCKSFHLVPYLTVPATHFTTWSAMAILLLGDMWILVFTVEILALDRSMTTPAIPLVAVHATHI